MIRCSRIALSFWINLLFLIIRNNSWNCPWFVVRESRFPFELICCLLRFSFKIVLTQFVVRESCFPFGSICCSLSRDVFLNRFVVCYIVMFIWTDLLFAVSWCIFEIVRCIVIYFWIDLLFALFVVRCIMPSFSSLYRDVLLNRFVVHYLVMYFWIDLLFAFSLSHDVFLNRFVVRYIVFSFCSLYRGVLLNGLIVRCIMMYLLYHDCSLYLKVFLNRFVVRCIVISFWIDLLFAVS